MKALVVDDDLALADVVSFTLRKAGYEVIVAYDGLVALDRWRTDLPDLIILDLNLPKLDGMSVCRQIRAQDDTPIIILSVRGEEDDIVTGLKVGADDYIVKPFSLIFGLDSVFPGIRLISLQCLYKCFPRPREVFFNNQVRPFHPPGVKFFHTMTR